ncbi:MAG TPA: hypothetical protein VEL12_08200 [Candidatus Nitrosopolaris sp.]|nr:hypothetical protein [Candidatus Nitrosopolaris sp.]
MLSDDEFLHAFFSAELPNSDFHHRDHLRLAWLMVRRHGLAAAETRVAEGIQHFAAKNGHAARYHDTMTRFWVRLVAHAVANKPEIQDFEAFLEAYPMLLDPALPFRHWRREAMFTPEARAEWTEPDLVPLPF